jgi:dienelactone hydrolase
MTFPTNDDHRKPFSAHDITHDVLAAGQGPGVLLMHELPGVTPECLELATHVMAAGYRVYLPILFGKVGERLSRTAIGLRAAGLCLRGEFACLAGHRNSPITPWLRALASRIYDDTKAHGRGIGVIGMCLTGNVVLSLMIDRHVLVPVMCHPSLPFELPGLPGAASRRAAAGVCPADLSAAAAAAQERPLLAFRFETDALCPPDRLRTIGNELKDGLHLRTVPTGPSQPGNIPDGSHSMLTGAYRHEIGHPTRVALDDILERFNAELRGVPSRAAGYP